jgi:signal peptidase I
MNGSGARDGGSPPWGPADPVPEGADTQAIPGLGPLSSPAGPSGRGAGQSGYGAAARSAGPGANAPDDQSQTRSASNGPGSNRPGAGGRGPAGAGVHRADGINGADGYASSVGNGSTSGNGSAYGNAGANGDGPGPDDGTGTGQDALPDAPAGKRRRSFWRELPVLVVIAIVLALLIKTFVVQAFYIPSSSMENTLKIGDRVLINKIVYHTRSIDRGDIVVFDGTNSWDFNTPPTSSNIFAKAVDELEGIVGVSHDASIYIKRVIGLPGDRVACCNSKGQVTVNGVPLTESSYLFPGEVPSTQKFSITVPAGRLWVMGDHRLVSYDSRGHMGDPGGGTIPESGVLGRAFVIIWPPSRWGFLNIPATFEQPQLNASAAGGGNAAAGGSSAALEAALDNGTPVRPATSPLPLALGFAGAVPLTWLQRRVRLRRRDRSERRDRRAKHLGR